MCVAWACVWWWWWRVCVGGGGQVCEVMCECVCRHARVGRIQGEETGWGGVRKQGVQELCCYADGEGVPPPCIHPATRPPNRPQHTHLKLSECGQMGVKRMAGTLGCTMEPPAATLYAVDPVGVANITPSACTRVISWSRSNTCGVRQNEGGGVKQRRGSRGRGEGRAAERGSGMYAHGHARRGASEVLDVLIAVTAVCSDAAGCSDTQCCRSSSAAAATESSSTATLKRPPPFPCPALAHVDFREVGVGAP